MTRVSARFVKSTTDTTALRFVFRDQRGPVGQDLDARSRRVLLRARHLAPTRTGRLRNTLRRETGRAPQGIYHDVVVGRPSITDYTGFVVFGTQPHIIRPTRRKALRFHSGGKIVFARSVSHPGNRANTFMTRALEAAR